MKKRMSRSRGGDILVFLVLVIFGVFMLFPFVYAVLQSFKPVRELFAYPPRFFVVHPTLENYQQIPQVVESLWMPIGRYVFNSTFTTVLGTALHILVVSMAAFPMAKYKFPGSRVFFEIIVLSLLFTPSVTSIPVYMLMAKTGMINTYWALLLPPVAGSLGLFLMKQFMSVLPDPMLEAASIDGAGRPRILFSIVMPNVKPAWLTVMIFAFQTYWNGTGSNYVYNENLKVLPTVLTQVSASGISRAGVGAAITVLLMVPPVLLFVLSQSRIIETMAYSGIKS